MPKILPPFLESIAHNVLWSKEFWSVPT